MLHQVCNGRIAVVGNGPLREEDRKLIQDDSLFDCVVRFNDRKNLRDGERTTVHVVRDKREQSPFGLLFGRRVVPGVVEGEQVFVQPITHYPDKIKNKFSSSTVLPPMLVKESNSGSDRIPAERYFPDCEKCKGTDRCSTGSSPNGPSSGTVIINALNASPFTSSLDVFGMNWNGPSWHFDFRDPTIVRDCCDKCTIHETSTSEYLPKR